MVRRPMRLPRRSLPLLLATPALAQAELRVAAVLPLSGPQAVIGDETWRGLELAAAEAGRVRLARLDTPEPAAAVAELRRLAAGGERPAAVFGTVSSTLALPASQAADALGLPYLELNAVADALTERGLRLVWRLGPRAGEFGEIAAAAMTGPIAQSLGTPAEALRVALLSDGGVSAESLMAAVTASLSAAGVTVALRFTAPASEMPGAVQRMRAAGADIAVHSGPEPDIAALFRAFREAAARPRAVLGVAGGHAVAETARAAGMGHDGTWVVDAPPSAAAQPFAEAYRRRYGAAPRSGHSLAAFSLALPVLEGLRGGTALGALERPAGSLANGWGLRFDARQQNERAAPVLSRWEDAALIRP